MGEPKIGNIQGSYLVDFIKQLQTNIGLQSSQDTLPETIAGNSQECNGDNFVKTEKTEEEPPQNMSKDAVIYAEKAASKAKSGDNRGAIDDYTHAIEINNKSSLTRKYNQDLYRARAELRAKEKDNDGAISDYQRALEF